jgi:hypothetical protein
MRAGGGNKAHRFFPRAGSLPLTHPHFGRRQAQQRTQPLGNFTQHFLVEQPVHLAYIPQFHRPVKCGILVNRYLWNAESAFRELTSVTFHCCPTGWLSATF